MLRPGGTLLVAFHIGDDAVHLDEWWGHKVCVDFFFFQSNEMARYLSGAAFEIEEIIERGAISRRGASEPAGLHLCSSTDS